MTSKGVSLPRPVGDELFGCSSPGAPVPAGYGPELLVVVTTSVDETCIFCVGDRCIRDPERAELDRPALTRHVVQNLVDLTVARLDTAAQMPLSSRDAVHGIAEVLRRRLGVPPPHQGDRFESTD